MVSCQGALFVFPREEGVKKTENLRGLRPGAGRIYPMRRAKLICTLGPASDSAEVIEAMIRSGMDVARLNFSHGTHQEHLRRLLLVRALSRKVGRAVAVLQDIQGPKIRLGRFAGGSLTVLEGQRVTLTTEKVLGSGSLIPTPLPGLARDVRKGEPILLDDGRVRLTVLGARGNRIHCRVEAGGTLRDHKGLNLPGSSLSLPAITRKDAVDLAFGQEIGVDYVALSFVRSAGEVRKARRHVQRLGTPLIAKIEKPQAVEAFEEIARVADGVMIARGDLGVEMPLELLPGVQKQALRSANRLGTLTIVATEMLESMVQNIRPTRAEVSDVANAIFDGADAVMLSGETAAGAHPVLAVKTMAKVVEAAERHPPLLEAPFGRTTDISTGVAAAAVAAAAKLGIEVLVAYTESGYSARLLSEFRPQAQILALTPREEVVRRVAMYWGVQGKRVGKLTSTDAMLRQARQICRQELKLPPGSPIAVVASSPMGRRGQTNLMTVHRI